MRTLATIKTPVGPQRQIFHGELPHSLTNGDAKRNGRVIEVVDLTEDPRSDSEILR